jgi:type I restriction-modification system DNA methylase subunit
MRAFHDILGELAPDGRYAIVLDDGFLFRKDENAFVETKRKLVDKCDLWAIIRLPVGAFVGAGPAVTNLLFFTKGRKTKKTDRPFATALPQHSRHGEFAHRRAGFERNPVHCQRVD